MTSSRSLPADQQALGAAHQQRVAAGAVDRAARGAQPLHGFVGREQRPRRVARGVFDRQSCHAGGHGQRHALGHALRVAREAALEVGVDRHIGALDQRGQVLPAPSRA
jgi:hypothetical protein